MEQVEELITRLKAIEYWLTVISFLLIFLNLSNLRRFRR
jgi:hypothetical protein